MQLTLNLLTWFYYASLLFVLTTGLIRFGILDKASRILCLYIALGIISESASFIAVQKAKNNLPIYTVYSFIEIGIISLYFNYSIDLFKKYNIGIIIGIGGMAIGIINSVFFQPLLTSFNSYFIFVEGIFIVSMAMFSFFRLLLKNDNIRLHNQPHFWFAGILSLYWSITFLNWGLYDYLAVKLDERAIIIQICLLIVNILCYLAIASVFFFYPKMTTIKHE